MLADVSERPRRAERSSCLTKEAAGDGREGSDVAAGTTPEPRAARQEQGARLGGV